MTRRRTSKRWWPSVRFNKVWEHAQEEHEAMLGRLFTAAAKIAESEGIAESGYRLLVNNGPDAGQEVYHLHVHILGGRRLGPMVMRKQE